MVAFLGFFGPKNAFGSHKHVKEGSGICKENL